MRYNKNNIFFGIIIFIALTLAYLGDPLKGPIFPCIFNKLTGLYCPGCGMTRAVHSIMHFRFKNAFRYNMLIFLTPPLLVLYYFTYTRNKVQSKKILAITLVLAIVYGIARNINLFAYLQPTPIK